MKLHKLKPGPIREFPVLTHNELVSEVEGLRRQVTELVDHRSPKSKSPVLVQLVWLGSSLLQPGRSVKLAAAAFDPTSVTSAPFSGLTFFGTQFAEGDQLDKYAIAMGPIAAATSADGTLTTRADDDTGTLTMSGGHGIATGDTIVIQWDGGARYTVQVGTVAGNSVPIDGGRGDVLPAISTAVTVIRSAHTGYGVIPEAYWAKVNVTDEQHTRAVAAAGTLLNSAASGGLPILWKPAGTAEKWCVVSILSREDRLVGADTSDGVPRELINKIANTGTYNPSLHDLVQAQLVPDLVGNPPDNKVRFFAPKGGSETERFRVFELIERKYLTEEAATIRWLDHNLAPNLSEDGDTIFDPMHLFAGAAAGYAPWGSEMDRGMRGIAELWNDRPHSVAGELATRTDNDTGELTLDNGHGVLTGNTLDVYWDGGSRLGMTAGTVSGNNVPIDGGTGDNLPAASTEVNVVNQSEVLGDPLWQIVVMEGFAAWIKGTIDFDDGPEVFQIQTSAVKQDHGWDRVIPVSTGGVVPLATDTQVYRPFVGDRVHAVLDDPDTDPPTYRVNKVNHAARRVRGTVVDPGSGFVSTAATTFQIENLTEVYGGPPPTSPLTVKQTFAQGYVAGQTTEAIFNEDSGLWENLPAPIKLGCHLDVNANGFIQVLASSLAGTGLTTETGVGGCLRLAASGGGSGPEKRLIHGLTNARVDRTDGTFEILATSRMAGGVAVTEPVVIVNAQLRAYNANVGIVAAWDDSNQSWFDISPVNGEHVPVVVRQSIQPATWNAAGKTLTPSTFQAVLLHRAGGGSPGDALQVAGSQVLILCENQSLDGFELTASNKAVMAWITLQENGIFVLDRIDCPEFTY